MVKRANLNEVLTKTQKNPRYPPLNVTCTNTNKTSGMKSFKSHQSMKWHCRDANLWVVTKRPFLPPSVYSQNKIVFPTCLNEPNKLHYLKAHFSKRHFIFPFVFASVCHQKQMRYNNIHAAVDEMQLIHHSNRHKTHCCCLHLTVCHRFLPINGRKSDTE